MFNKNEVICPQCKGILDSYKIDSDKCYRCGKDLDTSIAYKEMNSYNANDINRINKINSQEIHSKVLSYNNEYSSNEKVSKYYRKNKNLIISKLIFLLVLIIIIIGSMTYFPEAMALAKPTKPFQLPNIGLLLILITFNGFLIPFVIALGVNIKTSINNV